MLRVAAYTSGRNVSSARFRVRQYIPGLRDLGVEVRERWARLDNFPPENKALRPLWAIAAICERALSATGSLLYGIPVLQREMLSTMVTAEPLTKGPRALDGDDAIWLYRGGSSARRLARLCDLVICGNGFLGENFKRWNPHIHILPTAVDTDRYRPADPLPISARRLIGWCGSASTLRYLAPLAPVFKVILERHRDVKLRVVADKPPALDGIPDDRLEFIPWSPEGEVGAIQEMSIGLMPLEDTLWTRGKCSFKLLPYMACGEPAGPHGPAAVRPDRDFPRRPRSCRRPHREAQCTGFQLRHAASIPQPARGAEAAARAAPLPAGAGARVDVPREPGGAAVGSLRPPGDLERFFHAVESARREALDRPGGAAGSAALALAGAHHQRFEDRRRHASAAAPLQRSALGNHSQRLRPQPVPSVRQGPGGCAGGIIARAGSDADRADRTISCRKKSRRVSPGGGAASEAFARSALPAGRARHGEQFGSARTGPRAGTVRRGSFLGRDAGSAAHRLGARHPSLRLPLAKPADHGRRGHVLRRAVRRHRCRRFRLAGGRDGSGGPARRA